MVRPKKQRRITNNPKHTKFNQNNTNTKPIELIVDEYEAIRLKDYHNIKQKESSELMGISQPTFHRILNSARKKIATALIDGKQIIITGENFMNNQLKYKCKECNFQWTNPEKEYTTCPNCKSKNITTIEPLNQRKSFGGPGLGKCQTTNQPPKTCKCPKCNYETTKTKGIPCRNSKCPKCGTPLQGSKRCNI
ncbi:MAG: DUF134 domain-containing protein [Methanobacteriaceae archaeon]|nr:DUF134 domain-containing protein [Methanobacteriaceae archaeon]